MADAGAASVTSRSGRTGVVTRSGAAAASATSARSAVRNTVARSATAPATPVVKARAGVTQKALNSGTKVSAAATNVIGAECQQKFDGCMDSFCMLDNVAGGRCICSNKIHEFDVALAEIEKLNRQSYDMATLGVDAVRAGSDLDSITQIDMPDIDIESDNDFGDSLFVSSYEICAAQMPECSSQMELIRTMYSQKIKSDCAAYNNAIKKERETAMEKVRVATTAVKDAVVARAGAANEYNLGQCATEYKKCMQTTAGCGNDFSKCASVVASDNTSSRVKSRAAKPYKIQGATNAIEISAATYDTLSGKKPLCESVLKSCVKVADNVWDTFLRDNGAALRNAELIAENNMRQECTTNISNCFQKACKDNIDPNDKDGSYDLCLTRPGTMLNLCKVPLEKCGINATSESEAAKSPIWDFVVARLAGMRVDACTTQIKECIQSDDRCGQDYSKCIGLGADAIIRMCPYDKLTGCQKVYGADNITGDAVYEELANMIDGLVTNMDNAFYNQCQKALDESVLRVCGDAESCNDAIMDADAGSRALKYKICEFDVGTDGQISIKYDKCHDTLVSISDQELGLYTGVPKNFVAVIEGTIYWESVSIDDDGNIDIDEYWKKMGTENVTADQRKAVDLELAAVARGLKTVMSAVESDPTVEYCMTGRKVQGLSETFANAGDARFPNLTRQKRKMMAAKAFRQIRDNYYARYDELNERMLQDYNTLAKRMESVADENEKYARREIARQSCVSLADFSKVARTPKAPSGWIGTAIVASIVIAATVVACVFTFGGAAAGIAIGAGIYAGAGLGAATTTAVGAMGTAFGVGMAGALGTAVTGVAASTLGAVGGSVIAAGAVGAGAAAAGLTAAGIAIDNAIQAGSSAESVRRETVGSGQSDSWNYKETVTTNFDMETLQCRKCVRTQNCDRPYEPMFGKLYCKSWAEPVETCSTIQF
ncbi:MAG: hypothetical protein J6R22_03570 [Alphaproteobacteria bacterium]|nr:hypothetical protein [Alphaproteobacteria bacterium]